MRLSRPLLMVALLPILTVGLVFSVLALESQISLATSASAPAPIAIPPGKDESEAIRQAALAKMRAGPVNQPAKPAYVRQQVDVSTYPQGIRDVTPGQVPLPVIDYRITSVYQRVVGGVIWQVFAGARANDLTQGIMIVRTASPNSLASLTGASETKTYSATRKTGAIHLDAVAGDLLSFSTPDGTRGTFSLATGAFTY